MNTQTADAFYAKYNPLLALQGNPDFEILKEALGIYCSTVKCNWIASHTIRDWSRADQEDVKARIEKANQLTSELHFAANSFSDWEAEEDRTWDAGFTLIITNK